MSAERAGKPAFTSFDDSTTGDWQIIGRQMKVTQRLVADNVLALMRVLGSDHGGFPISRLEHCLQTATRAERGGYDDEYVLCALVHDIGDALAPYNHPAIATSMLRGLVSDANLFMVEHHDVFQGYHFWDKIGRDRDARERFRDSPWFDRTAEFCERFDQVSFDPEYHTKPLEHFEPLVRDFFAAGPSWTTSKKARETVSRPATPV
jgi:predicted HD phosphohydrolase